MALRWSLRPNTYQDSIKLMRLSQALSELPGVERAACVMATPLNLELLADDGLLPPDFDPRPDDLVVSVLAGDEVSAGAALSRLDELLAVRQEGTPPLESRAPRTLESAVKSAGGTVAVVAVPGSYAAAEAYTALRHDLHVFLFSDNVPLSEEVRLKRLAAQRGLLMMGPDCGTSIIDGVGLGFANRVSPGPVGIVGASGTGIQQVCCLLDAAGVGISAAIGTGGRDLTAPVGGSMTRRAVAALKADSQTQIIAVISKPADPRTAQRLHNELLKARKPVVVCLFGTEAVDEGRVRYARNLTDMADMLVEMAGGTRTAPSSPVTDLPRAVSPSQVCGLYTGGTLCSESAQTLDGMGVAHTLIDLGADQYTRGRAHPMIDPRLRASMLADLAHRPEVRAVLLDAVLGDLAHPDPAGVLLPPLAQIRERDEGKPASIFVTLVGTRRDPQNLDAQRKRLEQAGAFVFASNVEAATAAGRAAGGSV